MPMEWIGTVGLTALALCWIPQSVETIRRGVCDVNAAFLILSAVGSALLATYAVLRGDTVFIIVNILTTFGALVNIAVKFFPRPRG